MSDAYFAGLAYNALVRSCKATMHDIYSPVLLRRHLKDFADDSILKKNTDGIFLDNKGLLATSSENLRFETEPQGRCICLGTAGRWIKSFLTSLMLIAMGYRLQENNARNASLLARSFIGLLRRYNLRRRRYKKLAAAAIRLAAYRQPVRPHFKKLPLKLSKGILYTKGFMLSVLLTTNTRMCFQFECNFYARPEIWYFARTKSFT